MRKAINLYQLVHQAGKVGAYPANFSSTPLRLGWERIRVERERERREGEGRGEEEPKPT